MTTTPRPQRSRVYHADLGDLGGSGHGLGWSRSGLGGHLTWDLFYLQGLGPDGCLVAFAILMCARVRGVVVPTVLKCTSFAG